MIVNIVDRRRRNFRWKKLKAIAEAVWHDNSVADSDQAPVDEDALEYDERDNISLAEALAWGQLLPGDVTLFLYDAAEIDVGQPDPATHGGSSDG